MTGIVVIGLIAAGVLLYAATQKGGQEMFGMADTPVSLENIRRGVANGWYKCTLTIVKGQPAVFLSGKTADGKTFSDVYPIAQADYDILKADGFTEDLEIYKEVLPILD